VLINCDIGSEEDVIPHLKTIEGVKEVHGTFGAYDIIVNRDIPKTCLAHQHILLQYGQV